MKNLSSYMKSINKFAVIAVVAGIALAPMLAQTSVVKKNSASQRAAKEKGEQVTARMQAFFEQREPSDADLEWMRVIYRSLDLKQDKNMPLYYPEEPNQDGANLFFIIMRLIANDEIPAYEYLDGKEIFTDEYRIKVKDMLDRFHIIYKEAKGSSDKHPKYQIDDSDVPSNEVLSYYIVEKWEFDRRANMMKHHVEAICPVLHRTDDFGGDPIKYPMFWVKMDALRPFLAQQYVFTDNDNNLPRYSLDDYFQLSLYKGDIYKTKNLKNLSLVQMFPDPDDLKHAQDSIENRLKSFDKNLWVPSREELQALAEKREREQERQDSIDNTVANRDGGSTSVRRAKNKRSSGNSVRNKRSKNKTKTAKVKTQKSSSGSGAVHSVRRRR
jgi:gliding motility associated protien GldN